MRPSRSATLLPLDLKPVCYHSSESANALHPSQAPLHISSIVKSCTRASHLKQAHAKVFTHGLQRKPSLLTAATLSYLSLGLLDHARLLFQSIPNPCSFLRNTMIRVLATHGRFHCSLRLYSRLLDSSLRPDKFAFPFALKSCAGLSYLATGKQVHQHSICVGSADDLFVGASLVDMYSKCGDVQNARLVFDKMPHRDLVSWTSMISGYAHNGYCSETLEFFNLMRHSDVRPSRVGILSVLLACGCLGALRKGEGFHGHAIRAGFEADMLVTTAVIDMYAKCGSLDLARLMFDGAACKDVVCWSAMIASYGYHGLGKDAVYFFDQMVEAGVKPNHATLTSILSACSHSGMPEEGQAYFKSMSSLYGLQPKTNHYACMVDILGRTGKLYKAWELIEQMPLEPEPSLWGSLLGACRIHCNIDLAEKVADRIFELDPTDSGYYVLLSNIYATKSRWSDVERVRKLMVGRKVSKVQGISMIEFNSHVYRFGVGDRSHPQSDKIYAYLDELAGRMKEMGYVPLVDFTLHDIEDETKEAALVYHSERLAIAFGLININHGSPIRITKNLRVCGDCHNAIKIITKIVNRVIIVRDMNRFHHFENGVCSCGDYW